ncbi:MAG: VCBS repeat-containing protein [Candidatus Sumerlaeia bacterium]|nr:VCBS repeat-containing protein [Candidatus Sumerlaeia bacterium]
MVASAVGLRVGIFVLGTVLLGAESTAAGPPYPTGLLLDPAADKAAPRVTTRRWPDKVLPPKAKNITHLPVVTAQQLANCGAFAPSYYYKTYQEAREHGWVRPDPSTHPERVMSTGFTFPLANRGENDGASISHVLDIICNAGIPPLSVLPELWDFQSLPPPAAWRAALPQRAASWAAIDIDTDAGVTLLKEHLASGDIGVFAAPVYRDSFDKYPDGTGVSGDVMVEAGGVFYNWHALAVIGYDDTKTYTVDGQPASGAFLAVNSWGQNWGVHDPDAGTGGFIWFSEDFLRNRRPNGGPIYIMTDRIGYQPTHTAVLEVGFDRRNRVGYGAYPGSPTNPLSTGHGIRLGGSGEFSFAGTLIVDMTGHVGAGRAYTLQLFDDSSLLNIVPQGAQTGIVLSFHVEHPDGTVIAAPMTDGPVPILAGFQTRVHAGPFEPLELGEAHDELATHAVNTAWCDWDRDGDLDMAATGSFLTASDLTRLYAAHNAGAPRLLNSTITLPGLTRARLAWTDWNLDGLPDLSRIAAASTATVFTSVGTSRFVAEDFGIQPMTQGALAWGDYNNDGRPDLIIGGFDAVSQRRTELYRNDAAWGFVPTAYALPMRAEVALSWADMNNDGWLDLAVGGTMLRNQAGFFFEEAAVLYEGRFDTHAWADYNNDGRLDLAASYYDVNGDTLAERVRTVIFRNDGAFGFTDIGAPLVGTHSGSLAWGDFDNDGLLDLIVAGNTTDWIEEKATRLYRQLPGGTFEDVGPDLPDLADGSITWVDFDRDGALDLHLSGTIPFDGTPPMKATTVAFRGRTSSQGYLGRPNTPPSAPGGLRVDYNAATGVVQLEWDHAHDAEAPSPLGLEYLLRVGTREGSADVLNESFRSPAAGATPHTRLADNRRGRVIRGLPWGRYYWSVRTVDAGLAESEWAPTQTFVLGSAGLVTGDANGDGVVDAADLIVVARMIREQIPVRLEQADFDADARVTVLDQAAIAAAIQGRASTFVEIASATIGPEGGTLDASEHNIRVLVPPGAFPEPTPLSVRFSPTMNDYGPAAFAGCWRVEGLPSDMTQAIDVRLRDARLQSDPYALLGTYSYVTSDGGERWAYHKKRLTAAGGDWHALSVLPPDVPVARKSLADKGDYSFGIQVYLLGETQFQYAGGNFRITGPAAVRDKLPALAQHLEDALAKYKTEFGFNVSARDWSMHPLEVSIVDLGTGDDGTPKEAYTFPGWGTNSMGIQLSPYLLLNRDDDYVRRTVAHELFHVVQFFYDPRNFISRRGRPPHLWWNEATATAMERHFADDPDNYIPDPVANNFLLTFEGYAHQVQQAADTEGLAESAYGYAMANFAYHFVRRNGDDPRVLRTTYEKILQHASALDAIQRSDADYPHSTVFSSFFPELVMQNLFSDRNQINALRLYVAKPRRTFVLKDPPQRGLRFPTEKQRFLGASLGILSFEPPLLNAAPLDKLGFQLQADPQGRNLLTVVAYTPSNRQFELLGHATLDSATGTDRLILPDASAHIKPDRWLIPVVSTFSRVEPDRLYDTRVAFGVFRDYTARAVPAYRFEGITLHEANTDLGWPAWTCHAEYSAKDVANLTEHLNPPGIATPGVSLQFWTDPVRPVSLTFNAVPHTLTLQTTIPDEFGIGTLDVTANINTARPLEYQLRKIRVTGSTPDEFNTEWLWDSPWQQTGNLELTMDPDETYLLYQVRIRYEYHIRVTNSDGFVTKDESHVRVSTPFFMYLLVR